MAKGKYEYWLTAEGLLQLGAWARNGLTDEQIAKKMGISATTYYRWQNEHREIWEALKNNKEIVDIQVENALLAKALGISKTVKKPFKVKEVLYDNGKRISEKEHMEYADEEVYIPPDTTAQIFWLKNRKPGEWRDKRTVDTNNDTASNLLEIISNGMKEDISKDDIQELQQAADAGADMVE